MLERISSVSSVYVLRETMRPLFGSVAIGLLVMLSERLVRLLDITLGRKSSFSIIFEMLAYLVPHYLGLALPAAFFLGLLFGFNKLSKSSELDAFMAAGVGLHQLTRPVLILAIVFTLLGVLIFGFLQPHTRYAYRALVHAVKNVEIFYLAEEGVFMQAGSRTFILDELDREESRFRRIFLFEHHGTRGSETITASSGALFQKEGDVRPVLRLDHGHRIELQGWPDVAAGAPPPRYQVGEFGQVDTPLGGDREDLFRSRGDDERELTLPELVDRLDTPPRGATLADMRSELHKRIVSILTILVLPILAIPFALGRRRGERAYRFAVALVVLIVYNEIIEQGALAVRVGATSPWIGLWLPFSVLAALSWWRYYRACFTLRPDSFDPVFDRMIEIAAWVRRQIGQLARQL